MNCPNSAIVENQFQLAISKYVCAQVRSIPYRLQEALLSEEAAVTWVRNWGEEGSDAQRESKYGHAHLPKLQK